MRRSQIGGLLVGMLVGLAEDSLSNNPLGMFGIVKTLVGYFAASVGVRLDVEHSLMRLVLGFFHLHHGAIQPRPPIRMGGAPRTSRRGGEPIHAGIADGRAR